MKTADFRPEITVDSTLNESVTLKKSELIFLKAMRDINIILKREMGRQDVFHDIINILLKYKICSAGWLIFYDKNNSENIEIDKSSLIFNENGINKIDDLNKSISIPVCCKKAIKNDYYICEPNEKNECLFLDLKKENNNENIPFITEVKYADIKYGFFCLIINYKIIDSEIIKDLIIEIANDIAFIYYNNEIEIKHEKTDINILDSEKKYRMLFENVPIGLYTTDNMEKIIDTNKAFLEITNYKDTSKLRNIDISDFYLNIDDRVKWQKILNEKGYVSGFETQWRCNGGKEIWVSENAHLVEDITGQQYCEVSVENITSRKNDEKLIQETFAELRKTQAQLNLRAEWLEALNTITTQIARKNDLESILRIVMKYLNNNFSHSIAGVGLFNNKGTSFTIKHIEYNNLENIDNMLVDSETVFNIDNKNKSFLLSKKPGLFYINLNKDQPESGSSYFDKYLVNLQLNNLTNILFMPLFSDDNLVGQLFLVDKSDFNLNKAKKYFLNNLAENISVSIHNFRLYEKIISSYKKLGKAQEAMKEQERLKAMGQVASGITHDINNILSPITLYTEALIETEPGISERGRKYLGTIQKAVSDIENVTQRLRSFYKKDDESNMEDVLISEIFMDVIELVRPKYEAKTIDSGYEVNIEIQLADPDMRLVCVKSDLRESLINCIFNSADAIDKKGTIILKGKYTSKNIIISVEDNGKGMSEEEKRRCIEPFYTTKGINGTGLGLAGVFGMINRHGGKLDIFSRPDIGTSINMIFPINNQVKTLHSETEYSKECGPFKILCVDDDPRILNALSELLTIDGHSIVTTDNGTNALYEFRKNIESKDPFEIVITDLGMPGMSGYELAKELKILDPGIPVVLLSGWSNIVKGGIDIPENIDAVLEKPPRMNVIRKILNEMMNRGNCERAD